MKRERYDITIVVLTLNSAKTLIFCLDAIIKQMKGKYRVEIVIMDNGSTDTTKDILRKYDLKYFSYPELNIPQLRNLAVRIAKSSIIAFVDSDCVIEQNWVQTAIEIHKDPSITATGYKYSMPKNYTWLQKTWYTNNKNEIGMNKLIPCGNLIIKRSHFVLLCGFDERLETGEDADFIGRARESGYSIISDPRLISYHLGFPKTVIDFFKKEMWYGRGIKFKNILRGRDKPTSGALLFSIIFVFSIISAVLGKKTFTIAFGISLIIICLTAALHRKYVNKAGVGIIKMCFLYSLYFLARMIAILNVFRQKIIDLL